MTISVYFYNDDIPRPTEPVNRVFNADNPTVWDTGVNIQNLEDSSMQLGVLNVTTLK